MANGGVITPAMYQGGRISSNSHSWAVDQLFQNIGTLARTKLNAQPKLKRQIATLLFMYLWNEMRED